MTKQILIDPREVRKELAQKMLGSTLVTIQTGDEGKVVNRPSRHAPLAPGVIIAYVVS